MTKNGVVRSDLAHKDKPHCPHIDATTLAPSGSCSKANIWLLSLRPYIDSIYDPQCATLDFWTFPTESHEQTRCSDGSSSCRNDPLVLIVALMLLRRMGDMVNVRIDLNH